MPNLSPPAVVGSDLQRFVDKLDYIDGHWLWTASRTRQGYGLFRFRGKLHQAHRVAAMWWLRSLDVGEQVHHICRVTSCVNPSHLLITTAKKHPGAAGDLNRRKTHCPSGHPYEGANLTLRRDKEGRVYGRSCRTCKAEFAVRKRQVLTKSPRGSIVNLVPIT